MSEPAWALVFCSEHGALSCHVNRDGRHVNPKLCCCETVGRGATYCPIDLHNPLLYVGEQLRAGRPMAEVIEEIRTEQGNPAQKSLFV